MVHATLPTTHLARAHDALGQERRLLCEWRRLGANTTPELKRTVLDGAAVCWHGTHGGHRPLVAVLLCFLNHMLPVLIDQAVQSEEEQEQWCGGSE